LGSLQRSPNTIVEFRGPTSKGRKVEEGKGKVGEGRDWRKRKERGKGKGWEKREGREREFGPPTFQMLPPPNFLFKTSLNLPFFFGTLTEYVLCFNENTSNMLFLPINTHWTCRFMPTRRPRFRNTIKSSFVYQTYTGGDDFGLIANYLI